MGTGGASSRASGALRSRPAGLLDPALGRARAGTECFRPHGAAGGGRSRVGRTECAGARAQSERGRARGGAAWGSGTRFGTRGSGGASTPSGCWGSGF